ncbi:MAG: AbrB/MazE/SpoVT family DNA-binding domain-containing protein [Thermomicrobiales bacterium]|nr:AbrB/MazE/SpoVT family DNA-binding domain-containing protein [Thermomicrobiales bacterium]
METGKMTSRGRITIPIEIRRALGFKPGDKLNVERHGNGIIVTRALRPDELKEMQEVQSLGSVTEAGLDAKSV